MEKTAEKQLSGLIKGDEKMICPKCGHDAEGNFCSFCGSPLMQSGTAGSRNGGEESAPDLKSSQDGQKDIGQRSAKAPGDNERYNSGFWQAEEERKRSSAAGSAARPEKSRGSSSGAREDKGAQKQQKQMEKRIHALEEERDRLSRARQQEERRKKRESRRREYGEEEKISESRRMRSSLRDKEEAASRDTDGREEGFSAVSAVSSGVAGVVVLVARAMQIICCLLMLGMTWASFRAFWYGGDGLGNISTLITERNYGLAVYVVSACISVAMGILWSLWIMSGKAAGGGIRLKKYDTGRGFIPFLLCMAVVLAAGPASVLISARPIVWENLGDGVFAVLEAINTNHEFLLFCSLSGAILSFIRKVLRV